MLLSIYLMLTTTNRSHCDSSRVYCIRLEGFIRGRAFFKEMIDESLDAQSEFQILNEL